MKRAMVWYNLVAIFYLLWNTHCLRAVLLRGEDPSPWRLFLPVLVPLGTLIMVHRGSLPSGLGLRFVAFAAGMLSACVASAQTEPPKAVVTGVRTWYEAGEPLIFDASKSVVDEDARFHWRYSPEKPGKLQCELVDEDPKRLRFFSSVGTHRVTLYISSKYGFVEYPFEFTVYSNAPEPPVPQPVPVPPMPPVPTPPAPGPMPVPPAPPLPDVTPPADGKYAVARKVFDQAKLVLDKDATKKADLVKLVAQLDALKYRIVPKAGTEAKPDITTGKQVLTEVKSIFGTLLLDLLWQVFKTFLSTLLEDVFYNNENGALKIKVPSTEMVNPQGWADLIDEIAAGIRPLTN